MVDPSPFHPPLPSLPISAQVSDLGGGADLANYGEYSGDPSETLTFEYARTVLRLLLRARPAAGRGPKILLVGGGIANFTNVAETFKGIIRALTEFSDQLIQQGVLPSQSSFVSVFVPHFVPWSNSVVKCPFNLYRCYTVPATMQMCTSTSAAADPTTRRR